MKALTREDFDIKFTTTQKILSGKYALHLMYAMKDGKPITSNDLAEEFPESISHGAVKKQLKQLEELQMVLSSKKGVFAKREYSLTKFGKDIIPSMEELLKWEATYVEYFRAHIDELADVEEDTDVADESMGEEEVDDTETTDVVLADESIEDEEV